jgi:hypothetical protein
VHPRGAELLGALATLGPPHRCRHGPDEENVMPNPKPTQTSRTDSTSAKRKALLPIVAAAFKDAGSAKKGPLEDQFGHMAKAMSALAAKLERQGDAAHAAFPTQAAEALAGLAEHWRALGKKPGPSLCGHAAAVADHLDAMADALRQAASSVRPPKGAPPEVTAEVAAWFQVCSDAIFALALGAEQLRDAGGVSAAVGSLFIALPAPTPCACTASGWAESGAASVDQGGNVALATSWPTRTRPPAVDAEALACVLECPSC